MDSFFREEPMSEEAAMEEYNKSEKGIKDTN